MVLIDFVTLSNRVLWASNNENSDIVAVLVGEYILYNQVLRNIRKWFKLLFLAS